MILLQHGRHETLRVLDQGSTPTCTSHAFFMAIMEHLHAAYGLDLEFDYIQEFSNMLTWWEDYKYKHRDSRYFLNKVKRRVAAFIEMGREQGFTALTGEHVRVTNAIKLLGEGEEWCENICREMQKFGPVIFGMRRFPGHSLRKINPETGAIYEIDESLEGRISGHAMILIGFDRTKKQFLFQNSWGDGSIRWMTWENFLQEVNGKPFVKYVYSIRGLEVTE